MTRSLCAFLVGAASSCLAAHSAFGYTDRGAQLAAACAACHRLDGRDAGAPQIIGRSAGSLVAAMTAFKSDANDNHVMKAVARSFSNEEIEIVAQYLSAIGQPGARP